MTRAAGHAGASAVEPKGRLRSDPGRRPAAARSALGLTSRHATLREMRQQGHVEPTHISPAASKPMRAIPRARAIAGRELVGDRAKLS